jgi:hypothetical protein
LGVDPFFFKVIFSGTGFASRECGENSMDKKKLKEFPLQAIDREKDKIIGWSKAIAGKPELGYKETQTAELIRSAIDRPGTAHPWRDRGNRW